MDTINQLSCLLEEKKEKFQMYETQTLALLSCELEDMEQYIINRDALATEIDELSEEMARICSDMPGGDLLMDILQTKVNFENVPDEYHPLFYSAQAVRSTVNRIAQTERQAVERMELFRSQALEQVKQNKDMPKIKKYLTDLTDTTPQGSFKDEKA